MAGESAKAKAEALAAAAAELEGKSKALRRASDAYEKGSVGEMETAQLLAPLSSEGFHLLHDRSVEGLGGNIDHIVVGPPGVFVVNTKNWKSARFSDGALYAGPYKANKSVERQIAEKKALESILRVAALHVEVFSVLVFTNGFKGTAGAEFEALTLDTALPYFRNAPKVLAGKEAEEALAAILRASHASGEKAKPVSKERFALEAAVAGRRDIDGLDRYYSRVYVREWTAPGRKRLYLSTAGGAKVATHDLITGVFQLEPGCPDPRMVGALSNVKSSKDLASVKVPILLPNEGGTGMALLNLAAKVNVQLLVGWYWNRSGKHSLYVHLLQRGKPSLELGVVDLDTGEIKVKNELTGRASDSTHLIRYMWEGCGARE